MSVSNASHISRGGFDVPGAELGQVLADELGSTIHGIDHPFPGNGAGGPANENSVDDRRSGAVYMDGSPHFRRTWQGCRASQTGVENTDGERVICREIVVVIGESERCSRFEGRRHLLKDG